MPRATGRWNDRGFRRRHGPEHRPHSHPNARDPGRCADTLRGCQYGVTVQKSTSAPLLLVAVYSPHGTYDAQFLANYAYINLDDPITRVPGVANVQIFGAGQYAMRIWLDPDALARLGITVSDVINAVGAQNTVNPAGQLGAEPSPPGQEFTYSVLAQGRLVTSEQFGNIVRPRKS